MGSWTTILTRCPRDGKAWSGLRPLGRYKEEVGCNISVLVPHCSFPRGVFSSPWRCCDTCTGYTGFGVGTSRLQIPPLSPTKWRNLCSCIRRDQAEAAFRGPALEQALPTLWVTPSACGLHTPARPGPERGSHMVHLPEAPPYRCLALPGKGGRC